MKLYIKQKFFSWSERFTVKDETGADRYTVEGEIFTLGRKLHIYDANGQETAYIREQPWSFMPKYHLYIGGTEAAEIRKEFTFFVPKYTISGIDWEVSGDFMAHNYEITKHGRTIVSIQKEWMTWGDSYELNIADPSDALLALCTAIVIDCVLAAAAAANS